jgi:hypothetical protein
MSNPIGPPPGVAQPFTSAQWQNYFALQSTNALIGAILNSYTVASLPKTAQESAVAYATNGLKVGESAGKGTGVPVYYSNGKWRVFSGDTQVAS